MKVFNKIEQLVGKTPLFEVKNIQKKEGLKAKLLVKLEYFNPTGSIKDRASLYMIEEALQKGLITDGATIIEATSGNTGIALASIGASKGFRVILTMPDTMSKERIKLLKAYGAEVVLTDGRLGMQGAIDKAKDINANTSNSIIIGQFENASNVISHYETTAVEIWQDTDKKVDAIVTGIGSGGTISGLGKFFKEQKNSVEIIGIEPEESPLISKGKMGAHKLQGIGANFIPKIFDKGVVDRVYQVSYQSAKKCAQKLATTEGLLVGISSGATLSKAIELAKKDEYENKIIVAILADSGDRYLSSDLFE